MHAHSKKPPVIVSNRLPDNANQELCKVANWLAANKLSLNVKKYLKQRTKRWQLIQI